MSEQDRDAASGEAGDPGGEEHDESSEDQREAEQLAERGEPESRAPDRRLGLIADPDMPEQVSRRLARDLPDMLSDDELSWAVEVDVDPVTAGRHNTRDILASTRERMDHHNWDHAICLTDLPVRANGRPVVAEADLDREVAVVSLPALGGTQMYRRSRQVMLQMVDELTGRSGGGDNRYGLDSKLTRLFAPVQRLENPGDHEADVRYTTTRKRGRLRLLSGMVRSNQPAQLIFGLRSALAAAVATSAFGLSSSTIWQIGDQLGAFRQILAAVLSVALLVGWLIAAHGLWEKRRTSSVNDRDQVLLYNTSTVATLTIGIGVMYIGLFVVNLAVATFIVPPSLLASSLGHPADFTRYLALAWGFTTMGVIAGALGSSLESDQAVRQAAYGYREEQRRSEQEH
ncbi:hypothetical protein [Saccharopolyspora tripterygii]